jgi:primosomal protein N' (replication factor Y)
VTGPYQTQLFAEDPPPWESDRAKDELTARVVFAAAPHGPFDYRIPGTFEGQVAVGMRLRVPLGRGNRALTGWCIDVLRGGNVAGTLKPILGLDDERVLVDRQLIELVLWLSDYYLAPAGAVLDAIIPSGVRHRAGTRERTVLVPAAEALDDERVATLPPKQLRAVRALIAAQRPMTPDELAAVAQCTLAPIQALRRRGLLIASLERHWTNKLSPSRPGSPASVAPELTDSQRAACERLEEVLRAGDGGTLLLHGVTGSGKTEVYIRAIESVVARGKQAIVLVPEISLTPQTRQRFLDRFGAVAVLHSKMSPVERHEVWQGIASGRVPVVVGARSAIFAPLPRLGLIVIDEEHDASYKQDSLPRYHARLVAAKRAELERVPLVLGSATPSLEAWQMTRGHPERLLRLPTRVGARSLPPVRLVDLRLREHRDQGALSRPLRQAIQEALQEQGQVILLLNRRGYATTIQCPACGHVVNCPDCDLPLTHHRDGQQATCHYCSYTRSSPTHCPACRSSGIRHSGRGTQRLEQEIGDLFPDAVVARMDSDAMRKPGSHERTLAAFRAGDVQILVGTQMIAKGLDFPNVTLVGVINADTALHFPDFRAAERTFQLVAQVAGRTGRGERPGRVIVQTFSPEHPAIALAAEHDYEQFAALELEQRERFDYPPFGAMARVIVRSSVELAAGKWAEQLSLRLRSEQERHGLPVRILGPAIPPLARLRAKYRFHILLQGPSAENLRQILRAATADLRMPDDVQHVIDVDPLDML